VRFSNVAISFSNAGYIEVSERLRPFICGH